MTTTWRTSSYTQGNGACVELGWRTSSYTQGNGACVELGWRTSSYTQGNGACVELGWRTSSYTQSNGACVELAHTLDRVRDTKHRTGPVLRGDVAALVAAVKVDRIHR